VKGVWELPKMKMWSHLRVFTAQQLYYTPIKVKFDSKVYLLQCLKD